jgi:hypothetical protein
MDFATGGIMATNITGMVGGNVATIVVESMQ